MSTMNDESIRNIAYRLWLADGSQPGKDQEYWFRAQEEYSVALNQGRDASSSTNVALGATIKTEAALPLYGNVDAATPERISGWLTSRVPLDRRVVLLLSDGREVARATASLLRKDLEDAGMGDGRHGFFISLDNLATPIVSTRLSLVDKITRQPVPDHHRKLSAFGSSLLAREDRG